MRRISAVAAIGALLILTTTSVALVAADTQYKLSVHDAIETPTETVEIEGNEFEIDEIGVIEPGEPIKMDVTSSENYYVILYNTDQKAEHRERMLADDNRVVMGDADDDFDTASLDPGTYMLSLEPDDEGREAVTPVVVQGYDIDLEHPMSAEQGTDVELHATVEPVDDMELPEKVEVAIWDGDDITEITLDHVGGTSYETMVSLSSFETGTYNVYATVIGDETVDGYPTALAVDNGTSLTVTDDSDDDDGDGDGNNDDKTETDDGTGNESGADDETETDNGDKESTADIETTEDDESSNYENETDDETHSPNSDEDNGGDGDDTDSVIEPNGTEDTETDGSTSEDELGSPAALPVLVAITIFLLVAVGRTSP